MSKYQKKSKHQHRDLIPDQDLKLIKLSKNLSRILRHRAEELNLKIKPDGYVLIDDIIKILPEISKQDILYIVENNDKERFSVSQDKLYIRANQGHSIKGIQEDLLMTKITDPSKHVPINKTTGKYECVHGTSTQRLGNNIKLIKDVIKEQEEKEGDESCGLSKMARQHVHFAKDLLNNLDVKSGMRKSSDILVYCDLEAAIKFGYVFYESLNGVILCSGNKNGIVPSKFLRVEFVK